MTPDTLVLSITQVITVALLIWSEYLGLSPQHKSNAIADLLICGLGLKPHNTPNASNNV